MHVRLQERQSTKVNRADLKAASTLPLTDLRDALYPLVEVCPSMDEGFVRLRAGGWVGTLTVGECRVDVRPWVAPSELASMIRLVWSKQFVVDRSAVATDPVGLDELVAVVFDEELRTIQQEGFSRSYVRRLDHLRVLRGRPDFLRSFPWNDAGTSTIACSHHELTYDNLDNRLIRAALERILLFDVTTGVRRRLTGHRNTWSSLAANSDPVRADFERVKHNYTRLNEHYALAHRLAELILLGERASRLFDSGRNPTGGLVLNMASLFESFVEYVVSVWARSRGLRVESQHSDARALLDARGARYRHIRPDLVVYDGDLPVAVLDAKYKPYWKAEAGTGQPVRRISNEDIYQLFFYAERLQRRYDTTFTPLAGIVAPRPSRTETNADEVISDRFQHIYARARKGRAPCLRLLLLPLAEMLKHPQSLLDEADAVLHPITGGTRSTYL